MNDPLIHIFVYGTLKKGGVAHEHFCRSVVTKTPASVRGRLYLLPEGYPTPEVPEETIIVFGTASPLEDAAKEKQMEDMCSGKPLCKTDKAGWQDVPGEILSLGNPVECLPAIDDYEDFSPQGESLYHRVLLHADTAEGRRPAWTYVVAGDSKKRQLFRGCLISQWPPS